MDGANADGQGFLQVDEDVRVDAGAGRGALGGRGLVQQLLEAVELDQQHHVLQEVALDESGELRGAKELRRQEKTMERGHQVCFTATLPKINMLMTCRSSAAHLGVLVQVDAGLRGDVLGADDLTVSLKGLELEEFGCREELQGEQKSHNRMRNRARGGLAAL